ncbi:MAG: ferritin-like domain-containing protein [Candidatus Methanomethylicia archaeon]
MNVTLPSKFRDIVKIERYNALNLKRSSNVSNSMVKVLMKSIAYDSLKHADLFKALIEMLRGLSKPLSEEDYAKLDKVIIEHINIESMMIKEIEALLKIVDDERLKYVLRYILDDERRHHSLLLGLQEAVNRREVVGKFDWLNIVWKDVPFFF